MSRRRFFGQKEVDIKLRLAKTERPRPLVPWWARALRRVRVRWGIQRQSWGSLGGGQTWRRVALDPHVYSRRSVVKASFKRNDHTGGWAAHARYLSREGAQQERGKGRGFDGEHEGIDMVALVRDWEKHDELLWRFIVSPEDASRLDLREHVRGLLEQMERDLDTRLQWVAIDHHNTDDAHVHLLVRGVRDDGRPLQIDREYLKLGMRGRSQEIVTRELGPRLEPEVLHARERVIRKEQWTEIDRTLQRKATGSGRSRGDSGTCPTGARRQDRPSHILVFAPTRSGKGVGIVIPTLLTWPHSALVHDLKGENWALTAGARKRMGQICLKYAPALPDGDAARFNPLAEVRLRTPNEIRDVRNIAQMIMDPNGKGLHDHWLRAGVEGFTGFTLAQLYEGRDPTLSGIEARLSDPAQPINQTLEQIMTTLHDPDGSMGWKDSQGDPTKTHPVIARAMRSLLDKSDNERSGVMSEIKGFLELYRDPVIAANTAASDFRIEDMMNHRRPVSLYVVVSLAHKDSLRPLIRLMLSQILHRLTERLEYRAGRAITGYRHRLLLMIDEFASLGRLDMFADSFALIAGYGIKACLIAQDLSQIHAAYGHDEAITSNCHTRVAFTPNRIETARLLSQMAGEATVRHAHRTFSSTGASLSEPEVARPLITPDETTRLGSNEAMIFTSGQPAIRATKIRYYTEPFFKRRAAIPPPPKSDRVEQSASEDNARNAMPASSISNRVAPPPENRAPDQSHPNPVPSQARINPRLARSLRF